MRLLFAVLVIEALGACSSPPPVEVSPKAEPSAPDKKPLSIQAENAEWEKVLLEALRGLSAREQEQVLVSQRHYELALAWHNKGDFEKAKIEAQKSVAAWPQNLAARRLLSAINEIIVGGPPVGLRTPGDEEVRVAKVRVEQAQLEITIHLIHGRRYFDAKMYEQAIREFENAEFKIVHMPYDVKAMNDLLPQVRENLARAKNARLPDEK